MYLWVPVFLVKKIKFVCTFFLYCPPQINASISIIASVVKMLCSQNIRDNKIASSDLKPISNFIEMQAVVGSCELEGLSLQTDTCRFDDQEFMRRVKVFRVA